MDAELQLFYTESLVQNQNPLEQSLLDQTNISAAVSPIIDDINVEGIDIYNSVDTDIDNLGDSRDSDKITGIEDAAMVVGASISDPTPQNSRGNFYYVSPSGSDENSGS